MSNIDTASIAFDATVPAPLVNGRPVEVADGVFVIPDGRVPLVPNIGVIVGDRAALVVDSGLGPQNGAAAHRIARTLAGDRPLFLTLTHFHPEHGFGAQAFRDATIVYNRTQHDEFRQKATGYLAQFRGLSAAVAEQLEGVTFVDPHVVYDGGADLDLGGKLVQLRTWGRAHSRGDQVVFLPAERVLFTGDLVENRFYPIFPFLPPYDVDVDGNNWITVVAELQRLDLSIVVPGHGEVGDTGLLDVTHEYLTFFRSETKRLAAAGKNADHIVATITPQLHTRYPDWDTSEPWRIATGVQTFLAQ
ncbi:MAG: MBL fold metallo-hydrolase [Herpetosiphonaceae bacterium]|nr:MBL fold metallo-hydrolase [Herpetosiphonaceae bacterium]